MKFENNIDNLNIDLAELLSRRVVDTTINDVILETKSKENNEETANWNVFLDAIKENNEIKKIHKTDTKLKSKYGRSIVGFDIFEDKPLIWFADVSNSATSLRINGQREYAIQCSRTYSTFKGVSILTNNLTITDKSIYYLFAGSMGGGSNKEFIKETNDLNGKKNKIIDVKKFDKYWIPTGYTSVLVPEYILDNFKVGKFEHDYGVLPAMEMLNKDYTDDDNIVDRDFQSIDDVTLSDWWVARDFIDVFNAMLRFVAGEMVLDHTRIIGSFSQQELMDLFNQDKTERKNLLSNVINNSRIISNYINGTNEPESFLAKRLIIRTIGGESAILEKMQTTFKAGEYTQALEDNISLFFKLCGYNWGSDSDTVYENVSQTMSKSKAVYETTKEKVSLFERQWMEFYCKLAFAYFKIVLNRPFSSLSECMKSFNENVDFKIVSNILIKENSDWQKIIEMKQNNLISLKQAVASLNVDWTPEQIEEEVNLIKQDEEEANDNDYEGYNFIESEEQENMGR